MPLSWKVLLLTTLPPAALAILSASPARLPRETGPDLFTARSLRCFEGAGGTAEWTAGRVSISSDTFPARGSYLQLDAIDVRAGHARLIGNVGAADVSVLRTTNSLHFIERTAAGNLNIMTVFAQPPEAAIPGTFAYVYSRHVDMRPPGFTEGAPTPSQFHGLCRIWE